MVFADWFLLTKSSKGVVRFERTWNRIAGSWVLYWNIELIKKIADFCWFSLFLRDNLVGRDNFIWCFLLYFSFFFLCYSHFYWFYNFRSYFLFLCRCRHILFAILSWNAWCLLLSVKILVWVCFFNFVISLWWRSSGNGRSVAIGGWPSKRPKSFAMYAICLRFSGFGLFWLLSKFIEDRPPSDRSVTISGWNFRDI